jgi:hypothetical protein
MQLPRLLDATNELQSIEQQQRAQAQTQRDKSGRWQHDAL